ncbi:hypothetical protein [Actinoplanes sp. TFC3]|uniref:hypothetical protein n=1 Tax=Actinoplanes sp. TFC3 TaxID=1710355 RepID=UPI00083575D3|nr:hypothetical protein [Actinoplanes sp. TFC3]
MTLTQNDLRNAMNDVARSTEALNPGTVLRFAKRRRTRRRFVGVTGAGLAVAAVAGGVAAMSPASHDHSVAGSGNTVLSSGNAIQDLDSSLNGLRSGNYIFTRLNAYELSDVKLGHVALPGGYLVENVDNVTTMRTDGAAYLKPHPPQGYDPNDYYQKLEREGASKAEIDVYRQGFAQLYGTKWLRVDEQRLTEAADVEEQSSLDYIAPFPTAENPDITGSDALISAVVEAQRVGNTITGTLDATKIDEKSRLVMSEPAGYYGPQARHMPFEAIVDQQGRLIKLTLDLPDKLASQAPDAQPEPSLIITVSQYGGVSVPAAPAGAEPMKSFTYDLLARDAD